MTIKLPEFFKDYRLFQIFVLGIISGMPFAILYTTLVAFMKDYEIDLSIITTFAIARLPYSLKVFWSPVVDYFAVPLLSKFGRRKSWMVLSSIIICCILVTISTVNPVESVVTLRYLAITLGVMAATYDINYDALRIEMLSDAKQGLGAAITTMGYRIGSLITGGGALYIADRTESWETTFIFMAGMFAIGILFTMTVREDAAQTPDTSQSLKAKICQFAITPFVDILSRQGAALILLAIVLYKLGEALLGFVVLPFCMELGYSKGQIGVLMKGFGFIATSCGAFVGGVLVYKIGNIRGLICCGILQAVSNLMYLWLHYQPVSHTALLTTVVTDNFTGGMGSTALVAYLSILCNKNYTATQYAALSSLAALMNNTITTQSGKLIQYVGWDNFFYMTALLEIPSLILLFYIGRRARKNIIEEVSAS
jgi:PAT family beta-lactamase induction signal transducer AmpG